MSLIVKNALIKVTFEHILTNGTNSCWFKVKSTYFSYMIKYWRNQRGFRYLKIYPKLDNGSAGNQIGFITQGTFQYNP